MLTSKLRWFRRSEFSHPERIDNEAALLLDAVRERAMVPMVITQSWRDPGQPIPPGGSATSLHYIGRAFDIRIANRSRAEQLALIRAGIEVSEEAGVAVEIEWEQLGEAAPHLHYGWYTDHRPSRVVVPSWQRLFGSGQPEARRVVWQEVYELMTIMGG